MTMNQTEPGNITVGVLKGGVSRERDVSLETGEAVADGLREAGYRVREIDVTDREVPELDDPSIDVFFVALHGPFGEDGDMQEKLEERDRVFTGSGSRASRLGMDKLKAKKRFREAGLPTPPFHGYGAEDRPVPPPCGIVNHMDIGKGWVVKPRSRGSSIGIQMVSSRNEIPGAVMKAREVEQEVFVEPRLSGPEITAGILEGESLPLIELEPARDFYDYEAKYEDERTAYKIKPDMDPGLRASIKETAEEAFSVLGCRDFARVDFVLNDQSPYILEVNTIPGMTSSSLMPKAAREAGISFSDLCSRIVQSALAHS